MEHFSNKLFRWLQAGQRQNFCLLRTKKAKQLWLDAPLVPPEPIRTSACQTSSAPTTKETFEGSSLSRVKGKITDYSMKLVAYIVKKTACQETQRDTITNLTAEPVCLHCSHRDLNVSIHDVTFVSLSSN